MRPGGLTNSAIRVRSRVCPARAVPVGSDRGSMPISCRRCVSCPLSITRPCTTGDTGQPARRSSTNRAWAKGAPLGALKLGWGSPPIN
ncbi:hypothetical protein D3C81_1620920 [compost metagenome]